MTGMAPLLLVESRPPGYSKSEDHPRGTVLGLGLGGEASWPRRRGPTPRRLLLGPCTPKQRPVPSRESHGLRRVVSKSAGEHLELPRT